MNPQLLPDAPQPGPLTRLRSIGALASRRGRDTTSPVSWQLDGADADQDVDDRVLDSRAVDLASWEANASADSARQWGPSENDFVPLEAIIYRSRPRTPRSITAAIVLTLLPIILWIVAEIKYVDGNAWGHWDEVWYAAGAITILAAIGWVAYAVLWYREHHQSQ